MKNQKSKVFNELENMRTFIGTVKRTVSIEGEIHFFELIEDLTNIRYTCHIIDRFKVEMPKEGEEVAYMCIENDPFGFDQASGEKNLIVVKRLPQ